jgi:hypothetical protein
VTTYQQPTLSNFRAEKDFYTTREMSEIYGVSISTIRTWIQQGILKGEMYEPMTKGAKRGRYRIYPHGLLSDIETYRAELIEISMKSWPVLLAKLKKMKG